MLWMWLLPDSNSWAVHMAYHTGMCASILNSNQPIEGHPELLGWGNVFQDPQEGELLLWVLGHRRCWFSGLGHHSGTSPEPSSQSLSTQYPLMYMTIRCASSCIWRLDVLLLKFAIISFVFVVLRKRSLVLHHDASFSTLSLYAHSSSPMMSPTADMLSVKFTIELLGWVGCSRVCRECTAGESAHIPMASQCWGWMLGKVWALL